MNQKYALSTLISITNHNIGFTPTTPSEFNSLCWKIQKKTGQSISLSSIKRLWGYVKYDGFPATTTLNILAQFNDYKSWESFLMSDAVNTGISDSGFLKDSVINTGDLNPGDRMLIEWDDNKSLEIECIAGQIFRVEKSNNIKLLYGDTMVLHTVCIGLPIYVTDITRGEEHIPAYIGAKKGGVRKITVLPINSRLSDKTM